MKNYSYLSILMMPLLGGCVSPYTMNGDINNSAFMIFERSSKGTILGSSGTHFVYVNDNFKCNAAGGYTGEKNMAILSQGNPLVSNFNANGLRIEPKDSFRMLVRNVAGIKRCDVVFSIKIKPNSEYKVISNSDLSSYGSESCSVEVFELGRGNEQGKVIKVEFNDYKECKHNM